MLAADYAFGAAVIFMIGCNLYFGPRITSDRIAMQWDWQGQPNWHAPKWITLWGMVAFILAVRFLIWAISTYAPPVHGAEIGIVGLSLTVAAGHLYTLSKASSAN